MTWNYRIVATVDGDDTMYGIHEVYYDDKGVPIFYTSDPVPCVGDSLSDIFKDMDHMLVALSKPVLTEKDFTGEIERLS